MHFAVSRPCVVVLLCIALIGISFIVYSNSLTGEFQGDDYVLISFNQTVQTLSWGTLATLFSSNFFDIDHFCKGRIYQKKGQYYRPLVMVSFALDYALWGNYPYGYHLTNILLHGISGMFLFLLLYRLGKTVPFSFTTAVVFLVHPLHSPHIASVSGRTDLLCFVCMLTSVYFYIRYHQTRSVFMKNMYAFIQLLLYAGALFSKEVAFIYPAILLLYDFCFQRKSGYWSVRSVIGRYGAIVAVFVGFLYVRQQVVYIPTQHILPIIREHFLGRIITSAYIFIDYIKTCVWPVHIYFGWRYVPLILAPHLYDYVFFSMLMMVSILALFWSYQKDRLFLFGMGWMFLSYLPASNIIPIWMSIRHTTLFVGKQFFHIPLMGACIMGISLVYRGSALVEEQMPKKNVHRIMTWFFLVVIVCFSLLTLYNNIVWTTTYYYTTKTLEENPEHIEAWNDLGIQYAVEQQFREAEKCFLRSIAIMKEKGNTIRRIDQPFINLMVLYSDQGNDDALDGIIDEALHFFPDMALAYEYRALHAYNENKYKDACTYFREALKRNPKLSVSIDTFTRLLSEYGAEKESLQQYMQTLADDPVNISALFHIASLYRLNYLYTEAISYYERLLDRDPSLYVVRSNLAYCYEKLGKHLQAEEERSNIGNIS